MSYTVLGELFLKGLGKELNNQDGTWDISTAG